MREQREEEEEARDREGGEVGGQNIQGDTI